MPFCSSQELIYLTRLLTNIQFNLRNIGVFVLPLDGSSLFHASMCLRVLFGSFTFSESICLTETPLSTSWPFVLVLKKTVGQSFLDVL